MDGWLIDALTENPASRLAPRGEALDLPWPGSIFVEAHRLFDSSLPLCRNTPSSVSTDNAYNTHGVYNSMGG